MSLPVVATLDFGTSSVKVALVEASGRVVARAQSTYETGFGSTGEVEQCPDDWWNAACTALTHCVHRDRVVALSATGQMQDLICVDDTGAIRPALLYSDVRAGVQHERLTAKLPDWSRRTGNQQDSSNVVAKIAWLHEHEPQTLAKSTSLLFSAAGFVLWRAGAPAACDLTTASTTGLLDVVDGDWYFAALAESGASPAQLPRLVHGTSAEDALIGRLSPSAAAQLGIPAGIPLVMAMGDAGSTTDGLVGSAVDNAYLYLGTTGWYAQVVEASAPLGVSHLHSLVLPGWERRLQIGAVLSAGASSAWALATFLPGRSFAQAETLVMERLQTGRFSAVLCLPGLAGERTPVRNNNARGVFVGVTEKTDSLDLYIAVLTGVAMSLKHAADDMGTPPPTIALVGGAADSAAWRQIIATVFDAPVTFRAAVDPGNISAAMTAAEALGLEHSIRPLFEAEDATALTAPGPAVARLRELLPLHRSLYAALEPTFHSLAGL